MEDFLNFIPQEKDWWSRQDHRDKCLAGLLRCFYDTGAERGSNNCATGLEGDVFVNLWVFIDLSPRKLPLLILFHFFLNMKTSCLFSMVLLPSREDPGRHLVQVFRHYLTTAWLASYKVAFLQLIFRPDARLCGVVVLVAIGSFVFIPCPHLLQAGTDIARGLGAQKSVLKGHCFIKKMKRKMKKKTKIGQCRGF